jgi:hypothetical protein
MEFETRKTPCAQERTRLNKLGRTGRLEHVSHAHKGDAVRCCCGLNYVHKLR